MTADEPPGASAAALTAGSGLLVLVRMSETLIRT
jgi:hypothetical protein